MQRKRRHYETLGFLLAKLGAIWVLFLLIVCLPLGIMWIASSGMRAIGWIAPSFLAYVSIASLIIVFRWLTGHFRRQARKKLTEKRRRAQGRRKLSLELGLPVLSKKTRAPVEPRSFQSALAEYLNSIFAGKDVKDNKSAMSPIWLSPELTLKKVLPRSAKRLRYLLERIRSLVHPNAH